MISNLNLKEWVERNQQELKNNGYRVRYTAHDQGQCSVDIDGKMLVGTITCWLGGLHEIQFNDAGSGEVVLLETKKLADTEYLTAQLKSLGIL